MKEKIIIESKSIKCFTPPVLILSLLLLVAGFVFISQYHTTSLSYSAYWGTYNTVHHYYDDMLIGAIICWSISVISLFLFLMTFRTKIIVSNTRVSGRAMFGKQVDIPMDSISAVGKFALWKGVSVSSSSGMIRFLLLQNADEIFTVVGQLLQERNQEKKLANSKFSGDSIDDLKKYKDLYESGVITAEEFEAKKKQILGF